jgi:serine/threonine-protein kinase HipA
MTINKLKTFLDWGDEKIFIGILAFQNQEIAFEYDKNFLLTNLELSPFKLPLQAGIFISEEKIFDGLFGVFNDSLPDAWGSLLLQRKFPKDKSINPLERLYHVGSNGMGALCYEPYQEAENRMIFVDLDHISTEAKKILEGVSSSNLDDLIQMNSSFGGARPKITVQYDKQKQKFIYDPNQLHANHEYWLIKFKAKSDSPDKGAIEYAYSLMAKKAGLEMPETLLIESISKNSPGYFGVKRFDRQGLTRAHVHTVSGLLHADHNYPSLDYEMLLRLINVLCKNQIDLEKVFRQMVFNVLAHNRDDHSKNFSFIMNRRGEWNYAPSYDLTFSQVPGAEHSMLIAGEGKNPQKEHLIKIAKLFDIKNAAEIYDQVMTAIQSWKSIAKDCGITNSNINLVQKALENQHK